MYGKDIIEKLLSYATDKLYLAETDREYKKIVLCNLLHVDPIEKSDKTFSDCSLSTLKKEVSDYVVAEKLSSNIEEYVSLIV